MRRPDGVRARRADRALKPRAAVSLARALSKFGVCSRREAERWIADGRVTVNGSLERAPNRFIDPARDVVLVDGRRVSDETPRVVIALHKPVGLVTTRVDPGGRPTVYDALGALAQWVFPVGRLDRDSSGLLILTNDHRLGERLTAPAAHVPKTYHARVRGLPDAEALRALREGRAARGRNAHARGQGEGDRHGARHGRRLDLARARADRGQEPPGAAHGPRRRPRGARARARAHRPPRPRRARPGRVARAPAAGDRAPRRGD